ncbi:hypothetical protein KI614_01350 [Dechloromonas denitrificans]|jgi:hypothetical protein|uniref:hypothetical protein n=1 Tax=Dechloromonas denitrificans TaxID=281362 RepID=UPI001CF839E5|nr:hypothetical protein [Dechloromonas denitrificans]UCV11921.1 hypothetical protein KI614_01350 [Dechloromonas denitrificans]
MDFWFTAFVFAVAILVAVGGSLLLVGYVGTLPASFAFGWQRWVPTLTLPVIGPLWFSATHWQDFSRPGKQLIAGVVLIVAAVALLYGFGPHFVDRLAAGVK